MMRAALLAALIFLSVGSGARAADYKVDTAQSTLAFSGTHAGNPFSGKFEKWEAKIAFDPNDLPASHIEVTIDTTSAKTGNAMYDGTLPSADWLSTKDHPQATYTSREISKNADGSYTAKGTLTLRGNTQAVSFAFALDPADLSTPQVKTHFTLILDRLAFAIGQSSDPKAEWVSREITLEVTLSAVMQ